MIYDLPSSHCFQCSLKFAVSVLEGVTDLLPLPGVLCGFAPSLLLLHSLLQLGRSTEALDLAFKIVASRKKRTYLSDTRVALQLAQALILGAFELKQFDLSYLLAGRLVQFQH